MKKRQLEIRAESGLRLEGRDVARVSRRGDVITLRHRWAEHCDARVWDAVRRAFLHLAQEQANRMGRSVEVYDPRGWLLEQIHPEAQS